jgi:Acyl-CoA carboxylase epsilon subunit
MATPMPPAQAESSAAGLAATPALAIVAGNPSAEQIAAVVTVLSARLRPAGATGAGQATRSRWSARSRQLRAPLLRGPGAWRASALPR